MADRIIAAFDVAVVGGKIKRRPSAFVGEIHIGAMLQQIRSQLVVSILRRHQQGAPAIVRYLVDVRSRRQQCFHGIEIVGAHRIDQRRKTTAIFRRPVFRPEAKRRHCRIVILIDATRCSSALAWTFTASAPLRHVWDQAGGASAPSCGVDIPAASALPSAATAFRDRWIFRARALFRAPPDRIEP